MARPAALLFTTAGVRHDNGLSKDNNSVLGRQMLMGKRMCVRIAKTVWPWIGMFLWISVGPAAGETFPDKTARLWQPFVQWELHYDLGPGQNPFDVEATAAFTHGETGEKRTTGLFYIGQQRWAFRFTGTRIGTWTFETRGPGSLGGHRGQVLVEPNSDPNARGFI